MMDGLVSLLAELEMEIASMESDSDASDADVAYLRGIRDTLAGLGRLGLHVEASEGQDFLSILKK